MRDYLEKYAESEARLPLDFAGAWDEVVALPLYEEDELLPGCLDAIAATRARALVIAVVNGRGPSESNARALRYLGATGDLTLVRRAPNLDVLVVDRASRSFFPADQGVGLARKIGCDLALRLKLDGRIAADAVHTTDADARVASDYFQLATRGKRLGLGDRKIAAWIHPFAHDVERAEDLPLRLYEISLRYYVLGLEWAGSPYAYHTVGSTMAIDFESYARVRGFPRREAAEDFYLCAKLAKVGAIVTGGGAISLVPRPSARVPFGTGRSMAKIEADLQRGKHYTLYHPDSFRALREWLLALERFSTARDLPALRAEARGAGLEPALETMGAFSAAQTALATRKDPTSLRRHLHTWFDGFRTLKLVHLLRDTRHPCLPWELALAEAPFATFESPCPRRSLAALRALNT